MRLASLFFVGALFFANAVFAQVQAVEKKLLLPPKKKSVELRVSPYHYDSRLLINYSKEDLDTMRAMLPQKFINVENYYLRSYVVDIDSANCKDCSLTSFLRRFDITQYEKFRKKSKPSVVYTKMGYRVTVLAVDSLSFSVPVFQFAKD